MAAAPSGPGSPDSGHTATLDHGHDDNDDHLDLQARARFLATSPPGLSDSSSSTLSSSPANSASLGLSHHHGLAKSNSTASAGGRSMKSHVSIPVTGSIPYGSLRVVQPSDISPISSPGSALNTAILEEPPPTPLGSSCLENGDIFLILGLPEKFTIGCDTMAVTIENNQFLGIRDLPPGPHFIWVSDPNALCRCGYWFVTKRTAEVRVKQWDPYNEVLGEAASQFEARNHKKNIESLYPKLLPCRYFPDNALSPPPPPPKDDPRRPSKPEPDFAKDDTILWRELTSHITEDLLRRVTAKKAASEWLFDTTDTAKGEVSFTQTHRLLKAVASSELTFLYPRDEVDAPPHLLSPPLKDDPDTPTAPRESSGGDDTSFVTAELQFAYLTGALLSNPSCLDHWWRLLHSDVLHLQATTTSSTSAPTPAAPTIPHPRCSAALIRALHAQLVFDSRFLADGDGVLASASSARRRRLRSALGRFKQGVEGWLLLQGPAEGDGGGAAAAAVGKEFKGLEARFWAFGWDLRGGGTGAGASGGSAVGGDYRGIAEEGEAEADEDDEDEESDDYAPVVVKLDETGREVGLVSWG